MRESTVVTQTPHLGPTNTQRKQTWPGSMQKAPHMKKDVIKENAPGNRPHVEGNILRVSDEW